MGRKWTDEEKKAFGVKMKALRDAKAASKELDEDNVFEPDIEVTEKVTPPTPEPVETTSKEETTEELLKRALEAIANLTGQNAQAAASGTQVANGKLVGTTDKFSMDFASYPDPTSRLREEKVLERFGFKSNYELKWSVSTSRYQTIDGIWQQEPKFNIDLIRVLFDEETGKDTGGRYIEYRIVFHEDPDAAMVIARDNGVTLDTSDEKGFLDEMRYLRVRDWLLECFMPKAPKAASNNKQMVINGKLVEYYEVNSEDSASIPFNKLSNKL